MAGGVFRLAMTLVVRVDTGQGDSWNQNATDDELVPVKGYFWQSETFDPDEAAEVTGETLKAAFLPPAERHNHPKSFHALRYEYPDGMMVEWEIVGKPEPKYSLARGRLHHYEVKLGRAAA
jgi:hypothetical protein